MSVGKRERERERERECVSVCECVKERERWINNVCMHISVCTSVCVCVFWFCLNKWRERERERERECSKVDLIIRDHLFKEFDLDYVMSLYINFVCHFWQTCSHNHSSLSLSLSYLHTHSPLWKFKPLFGHFSCNQFWLGPDPNQSLKQKK